MPGIASVYRADRYTSPRVLYRTISVVDGAVDPLNPPNVPLIDGVKSAKGINTLILLVDPGSGTCTIQTWVVDTDGRWYFAQENSLAVAGRPERVVVNDLPNGQYAVVATVMTNTVEIKEEHND